ncbi:hypothetical protein [Parasitella parasitica]|uniref:Uncharacterized protein n=1 Tax=Parasitella parasitica TaxID=35722 RepID=A0A0B7MT73_9FUNG|nr:hypothetical protein [Parasitella parasitica]
MDKGIAVSRPSEPAIPQPAISLHLRSSNLPGLTTSCSNFVEPDDEMKRFLNFDLRLAPQKLSAVAKLHCGSLVVCEEEIILLLTCEAYGRSKSTDAHAGLSMKSLPQPNTIFVCICNESDGSPIKSKLKIGGQHMNILSTMSVRVGLFGSPLQINIGPETKMSDGRASIFYPEENIQRFKASMADMDNFQINHNINHLRQVVAGFGDISTYKEYRCSLDILNHETLMPATVFTLCDLPHSKYGVSDTAATKIASRFLNVMSAQLLRGKTSAGHQQLNDVLSIYNAHTKKESSQQWKILNKFVQELNSALQNNNGTVNILDFGKRHASPLTEMINSCLATANAQIKENVMDVLSDTFGDILIV